MNLSGVTLLLLSITSALPVSIDTELVFQLKKYFRSDLILIAKDETYSKDLTKTFYKKNFPDKSLLGIVDLNENFENDIRKVMLSPFLNVLVVSSSIKLFQKLKEFQESIPKLMTRLIYINFMDIWINSVNMNMQVAIKNLYIPLNSKCFLVQKLNESRSEVIDVYQIFGNSSNIYSVFAIWENNQFKVLNKNFHFRRRDLQGRLFNVPLSPLLDSRGNDDQLWDLYSKVMNFSYQYVPVNHGAIYPNGTKTGLFKLLDEGVIDTSPTDYVYAEERLSFFDYIFPATISEVRMYLKLENHLNWTSYFAPFSAGIWITVICWMLIASMVTKFISHVRRLKEDHVEDSTLRVLRAICYQSGRARSSSTAFYISYIMPYILTIALTQFYSGALLSHLTVKNYKSPVETLNAVIQDGSYKITVLKGTRLLFNYQTNPGHTAVRNLLTPMDQLPVSMQSGFSRLCDNRYVFLTDSTLGFTINEKCHIFEGKEIIVIEPLGILVKKGFAYRDVMTKLLRVFQRAGLQKLKKKNLIISYDDSKNFKSLSMESIFPIFLLHLNALIISAVVLVFEIQFPGNRDC